MSHFHDPGVRFGVGQTLSIEKSDKSKELVDLVIVDHLGHLLHQVTDKADAGIVNTALVNAWSVEMNGFGTVQYIYIIKTVLPGGILMINVSQEKPNLLFS